MITAAWSALVAMFGIGKIIAAGAIAVALAAFISGVYAKGYYSCVSKYELAAVRTELRLKTEELKEMQSAMEFGDALARLQEKAEKRNKDAIGNVIGTVPPGSCLGPDFPNFLRRLPSD